jgi:hypothetical protein
VQADAARRTTPSPSAAPAHRCREAQRRSCSHPNCDDSASMIVEFGIADSRSQARRPTRIIVPSIPSNACSKQLFAFARSSLRGGAAPSCHPPLNGVSGNLPPPPSDRQLTRICRLFSISSARAEE